MKILFVGLGSIGQRHLRNLKSIFGDEVQIFAYRERRLSQTFSDDMRIRVGVDLEKEFHIQVFSDYAEALRNNPEVVFITTITAKHVRYAIEAAKAGCDIFMEKPLSNSFDGIAELVEEVRNKGVILYMGYQNRYHPCIQYSKEIVEQGLLGRLISVDNEFSERLSTMHSYEDYRQTYMARKDMGGGPILNLQIHCLDYLQWLLGDPVSVYTITPQTIGLEIDVEGAASTLFQIKSKKGYFIPVFSHTDFFQFPPAHKLKIVGEKGTLEADINNAICSLYINGSLKEEKAWPEFVRNNMFISELKEFFECIKTRIEPSCNIEQGVIGLKMALAAKMSAKYRKVYYLEDIK